MFVVVAIPARLESSRLPNKLLADIGGQPMIRRVLTQCSKAKLINELILSLELLLLLLLLFNNSVS